MVAKLITLWIYTYLQLWLNQHKNNLALILYLTSSIALPSIVLSLHNLESILLLSVWYRTGSKFSGHMFRWSDNLTKTWLLTMIKISHFKIHWVMIFCVGIHDYNITSILWWSTHTQLWLILHLHSVQMCIPRWGRNEGYNVLNFFKIAKSGKYSHLYSSLQQGNT